MSTVTMQAVVSVDGYIAYDDDLPGHLFDWSGNGDVEGWHSEAKVRFVDSVEKGSLRAVAGQFEESGPTPGNSNLDE